MGTQSAVVLSYSPNRYTNMSPTALTALSTLLLLGMVASIRADVSCDECKKFVGNVQRNLLTADHVTEQTNLMSYLLCQEVEDVLTCNAFITKYWPKIAPVLYPKFAEPNMVCGELGACGERAMTGQPTCEECLSGVNNIASLLTKKIPDITEFLVGEGLCANSGADAETCAKGVRMLMPQAMTLVSTQMYMKKDEYCCYEADYVCC